MCLTLNPTSNNITFDESHPGTDKSNLTHPNLPAQICQTTPRIRSTEHLFLDLPELKPQLEKYINETSEVGEWSANSIATTASWIRDGLKPRCITRDLKWGVPVPLDKYKDKVRRYLLYSLPFSACRSR